MTRSNDLDIIAPDDPVTENIEKYDACEKVREILGHTTGPLSSTLIFPDYFDFSEKNEGEIIYTVLRPHWYTNVSWILLTILMLIAPLVVRSLRINFILSTNIFTLVFLFWYMITFAFTLQKFISWYFDIFIITNFRVIDIDVHNLLDRKFSEAQIDKIQDINYKVAGLSQTFFNYGTLKIETAGENPDIEFEKIAAPGKIMKLLQGLCQNVSTNK